MRHIYCVAAQKLILNVSKIRLRLICARASYLHRLFSKALEILNGIYFSPEPSRRIRTDKDVRGSKQYRVRIANSQITTVQGGTVVVVPAGVFCALLAVAERTGMSVVLRSSDVFAAQKLASRSVHGCTLLDSLFLKAFILYGCITASALRVPLKTQILSSFS